MTPTSSPVNATPVKTTGTATSTRATIRSRDDKDSHPDNAELPGLAQFVALLLGLSATPATAAKSPSIAGDATPDGASPTTGTTLPPDGNGLPPETAVNDLPAPLKLPSLSPISSAGGSAGQSGGGASHLAMKEKTGTLPIKDLLKMTEQLQKAVSASPSDGSPATASALATAQASSARAAAPPPTAALPPGAPLPTDPQGMATGVASRVQWMVSNQQPLAKIAVNPAHLGPVEISVQVDDGGKARIAFTAHHEAAREAIQAATPRLRELLGQSGLNLVQVSVGQQDTGARQQQPQGRPRGGNAALGSTTRIEGVQAADPIVRPMAGKQGMVDDYA